MIKDSGMRETFESGAVRDVAEGKGRCDLLPLDVLAEYLVYEGGPDSIFIFLNNYIRTGNTDYLMFVLDWFSDRHYKNDKTMFLEVAKHYEAGAKKYDERNWEKGIPLHRYIDSAVRHYLLWLRGDTDEPHDRAFVWNILGALWTHENRPEMIDLPFAQDEGFTL